MISIGHSNGPHPLQKHQLGDFALYYSIFAHFGKVRFYTQSDHLPADHKFFRAMTHWKDMFEVEIIEGRNQPMPPETITAETHVHLAREHNIRMAPPNVITKPDIDEPYVTYQTVGNTLKQGPAEKIMEVASATGHKLACIDNNSLPLDEFFGLLQNSEEHIGWDSGPAWLACGMGKKVTMVVSGTKYGMDAHSDWREWGKSTYPDTFKLI